MSSAVIISSVAAFASRLPPDATRSAVLAAHRRVGGNRPRRRGRRDIVPYHLSRLARDQFRRIAHVKPQESFAEQPVGAIKLGELDERARGILLGQRERFAAVEQQVPAPNRKSTRLNSSH